MHVKFNAAQLDLIAPTIHDKAAFIIRQSYSSLAPWMADHMKINHRALQDAIHPIWDELYASEAFAQEEEAFHLSMMEQFCCLYGGKSFRITDCASVRLPYMAPSHRVQLLSFKIGRAHV